MALPEPRILHYTRWLEATRGLAFDPTTTAGYDALWRWSVGDLTAFWASIWDYFDVQSPTPWQTVLVDEVMPGARWFPGAQVNYAQQVMRHADAAHAAGHPAILFQNEEMRERGELHTLSWPELRRQVGALAAALAELGVGRGDRVCAFLPNTPHTAVAFLAVASLGAIWSICSLPFRASTCCRGWSSSCRACATSCCCATSIPMPPRRGWPRRIARFMTSSR